jgi:hypothetical protein
MPIGMVSTEATRRPEAQSLVADAGADLGLDASAPDE